MREEIQPWLSAYHLSWATELGGSRQIIFKALHKRQFLTTVPSKAYKNQGQLQMFVMGKRRYLAIWIVWPAYKLFFWQTNHEEHQWNVALGETGVMLAAELRPGRGWPQSGKQTIVKAEELCCLQGPDTQALIVVSPLHISQTKLTQCTWPFTHSLFSLALLHSASSLPQPVWSRFNHLSVLLLDCPISRRTYNWMWFQVLQPTQVCFSPKTPELMLLLSGPVFLRPRHLVWAFTLLHWPRLLILTEMWGV